MSQPQELDLHLPCFPTPPYEGPEDDWMAEFDQLPGSPISSLGGESLDELGSEDLSEFRCVNFSDILLPETDPTCSPPPHAPEIPTIECAPGFGSIEVDRLLDNLEDLDIPDFASNVSCSNPELKHTETQDEPLSAVVNAKTLCASNVSDAEDGQIKTENIQASSSVGTASSSGSKDSYKEKLRKRPHIQASTSDEADSTETIAAKNSKQPALQMMKVSHLDQFRKERPTRSKGHNTAALISMEAELEADKSRKAAIQARINREKKKAYISSLETERDSLQEENESLRGRFRKLEKSHKSLQQEVDYLRNVLQNQSMLAGLLKNIGNTRGVALSSSLVQGKRKCDQSDSSNKPTMDHDYGKKQKQSRGKQGPSEGQTKAMTTTGGICLHVQDDENVSLEFCSECAKHAKISLG